MLKDQKVLVTGATGQVARPIAEQLNANNEVWAAARFSDPEAKGPDARHPAEGEW